MDSSMSSVFEPYDNNGLVSFMRQYGARRFGCDIVEASLLGQQAWNNLSQHERNVYKNLSITASISDVPRVSKSKRIPSCVQKRKCKPRAVLECKPKPSCAVRRSMPLCRAKSKKLACKPGAKKLSCLPKTKKSACRKPRPRGIQPKQKGRQLHDGYVIFLRDFLNKNRSIPFAERIMEGARFWCNLPQDKKDDYGFC